MNTEQKLFDALDRIANGESRCTNGKLSQENVAKEADVSRATFNRYQNVVDEFNRLKRTGKSGAMVDDPFTIQDKNKELQSANVELRQSISRIKKEKDKQITVARQEIYILNRTLEQKEEKIASLRRELATCKSKEINKGFEVVK